MDQQLSGIDASFLYLETPETPMHVAGLTYFELPTGSRAASIQHFRRFFESRLHTIPIFAKRLAPPLYDLDHPGWVDADDLDLDYHLRETLPPRAPRRSSRESSGACMPTRSIAAGRLAILRDLRLGKTARAFSLLEGPPRRDRRRRRHGHQQGALRRDADAARGRAAPPRPAAAPAGAQLAHGRRSAQGHHRHHEQHDAPAGPHVAGRAGYRQRDDQRLPRQARRDAESAQHAAGLVGQLPTLSAPKTPFNATITRRQLRRARSRSASPRPSAAGGGAKLNDVVMAVCAGALRRYLQEKGRPRQGADRRRADQPARTRRHPPEQPGLRHALPDRDRHRRSGERLRAIVKSSSESAKQIAGTFRDAVPQDFAFVGAPILLQLVMLVYGRSGLADRLPMPMNVTISNVPGPPMALYCAGAKVTALHPVSIPAHGAALNITVQSYTWMP